MGISTLVVGVGGTGVTAVRAVKKLYYQKLSEEARASAAFLAIDFDRSALDRDGDDLAELDPAEFLYLDPEGIQVPVRNIDRAYETRPAWETVREWFPDPTEVTIPTSEVEANGAGQFRMLGRLGFFLYDSLIEKTLLRAYESLGIEIDRASATRERRVILVASIAGGTGSGMMIDLAYVVRRHLEGRPRVFAYLVLPEVFAEVDHGGRIYQNAYATLRELAHLKDQLIPFRAQYFDIAPIDIPAHGEQPFSRIFLFGRAKGGGRKLSTEQGSGRGLTRHRPDVAAVLQMAQAILPQLDRRLQEKSRAVAANTTASTSSEMRHRLQMQVFSTSGGDVIPLGNESRVRPRHLFYEALRRLAPDQLSVLYAGEGGAHLDRLLDQAERGAAFSGTDGPGAGADGEERDDEKRGELLRDGLRSEVGSHVGVLTGRLFSRLEEKLLLGGAAVKEEAQTAVKQADLLKAVLLGTPAKDASTLLGSLEKLELDPAGGLRKAMADWRNRYSPASGRPQSIKEALKKAAHLRALQAALGPEEDEVPIAEESDLDRTRKALQELATNRNGDLAVPGWRRLVSKQAIKANYALAELALLKSIGKEEIEARIRSRITADVLRTLRDKTREALHELADSLANRLARLPEVLRTPNALEYQGRSVSPKVQNLLEERLREVLPALLDKLENEDLGETEDARALSDRWFRAFQEVVLTDSDLDGLRFDLDPREMEERIIGGLVGMRQNIFVRRTPNPRRKGIAYAACPNGFREGNDELQTFLEVNAEQLLLCRCNMVSINGDRIWIYYEDLFNPPDHLRKIEDYYVAYKSQEHPCLFHIDRRFLELDDFRQIVTGTWSRIIPCGNPGCTHNLSGAAPGETVCGGCGGMIISRCGNPGCEEDALHAHALRTEKSCPSCGGFNHAAWWKCNRHGKDEVLVPIDKKHCPKCILRHHEEPLRFPMRCVGKRPDLECTERCPRCVDLHEKTPTHAVFEMRGDLARFYRDGVNGHDLEHFRSTAESKHGLRDGFRCPNCRTPLIPVHHRRWTGEECP